jgi:hypothetical protein
MTGLDKYTKGKAWLEKMGWKEYVPFFYIKIKLLYKSNRLYNYNLEVIYSLHNNNFIHLHYVKRM